MFLTWFTFFVLKLGAYVKERNNNSCQKHNQILMLVVAVLLLSFRGQCVITLKAGGEKTQEYCFVCFYSVGSEREAYRVTAQMVLVCCWRSMKEVSMLLGELCQSMPLYTHSYKGLITEEQVSKQ